MFTVSSEYVHWIIVTVVVIKFVFTMYIPCLGLPLLYLVIQHFCCQSVTKILFSSVTNHWHDWQDNPMNKSSRTEEAQTILPGWSVYISRDI